MASDDVFFGGWTFLLLLLDEKSTVKEIQGIGLFGDTGWGFASLVLFL